MAARASKSAAENEKREREREKRRESWKQPDTTTGCTWNAIFVAYLTKNIGVKVTQSMTLFLEAVFCRRSFELRQEMAENSNDQMNLW